MSRVPTHTHTHTHSHTRARVIKRSLNKLQGPKARDTRAARTMYHAHSCTVIRGPFGGLAPSLDGWSSRAVGGGGGGSLGGGGDDGDELCHELGLGLR